jgi:hypothetical protein
MLKTKFWRTLPVLVSSINALFLVAQSATAQCPDRAFTIGESSGSVRYTVCGVTTALEQAITNDPGPGGLSNVLAYDIFDSLIVGGDVLLKDVGTNTISDVLRFDPGSRAPLFFGATLYFYSLSGPGFSNPADIGFPTAFNTNTVTIQEGSPYIPTAGQPGFPTDGGIVSYGFVSDATPEPGTFLLATIGIGLLVHHRPIGRRLR